MNPERTITITRKGEDGKPETVEVRMLYCAASETGYQSLSGKTMDVFMPRFEKNEEGKFVMTEPPSAQDMDYIQLSIACIIAAYERDQQEVPITSEDILYNASREEVVNMVATVVKMYQDWLLVPSTIEKEINDEDDGKGKKRKNSETPTRRSKRS